MAEANASPDALGAPRELGAAIALVLAEIRAVAEGQRRAVELLTSERGIVSDSLEALWRRLSAQPRRGDADDETTAGSAPQSLGEPWGMSKGSCEEPHHAQQERDSVLRTGLEEGYPRNAWPTNVKLRKEFAETSQSQHQDSFVSVMSGRKGGKVSVDEASMLDFHAARPMTLAWVTNGVQRLVMHPNSSSRMLVDILSCLFLMSDMFITPYVLAWNTPLEGWLQTVAYMTLAFWSFDMVASFFTGFYKHGELEMRPNRIMKHYLKNFFIMDVAIVGSDWASTMIALGAAGTSDASSIKAVRLAKATRLLRIVAVLRMVRISSILEDMMDSSLSDSLRTFMHISKLLCGILWLNHVFGCLWYAIGRNGPSDTGSHWTSSLTDANGHTFEELSEAYQYVTTFHWAMIQLANGSMEVLPQNTLERLFTIACLVLGVVIGCSLVSSISATVMQAQNLRQDHDTKVANLRLYLRQQTVDQKTSVRVLRQYNERTGQRCVLKDKDVPALCVLSSTLRAELQFVIFGPHLRAHPLIRLWSKLHPPTLHKLCRTAVHIDFLLPTDILFTHGSECQCAYYVVSGSLEYRQDAPSGESSLASQFLGGLPVNLTSDAEEVRVGDGAWLCEVALWSHWKYVGELECISNSKIVTVDARNLFKAIESSPLVMDITLEYAQSFHARVISAKPPASSLPTDVHVPFTDYSQIVSAMSPMYRAVIGQMALGPPASGESRVKKLASEVSEGTATVVEEGSGEVLRVVAVSTLRIARTTDDCVLVCLGRTEEGLAKPSGKLPGAKQKGGELPSKAIQRVLEKDVAPLQPYLRLTSASQEVVIEKSKQFGVRTKYLRTVQRAEVGGGSGGDIILPVWMSESESVIRARSSGPSRTSIQAVIIDEDVDCVNKTTTTLTDVSPGPSPPKLHGALPDYDVLLIRGDGGKESFYAWLPAEEFAHLSQEASKDKFDTLLQSWLLHLEAEHMGGRVPVARFPVPENEEAAETSGVLGPRVAGSEVSAVVDNEQGGLQAATWC